MTTTTARLCLLTSDPTSTGALLPDGSLWSHAATFGDYVYDGESMPITPAVVASFVRNFRTGYPQKVPVDYDHTSTTLAGRQAGPVPKAGDVLELANVQSADDLTPPMRAAVETAGRALADPRNFGLWMRWKPTPRALALLRAREYSELSITFYTDYANNRTGETQGPTIIAVALTNTPFLDGMVPVALSRAGQQPSGTADAPRDDSKRGLTMKGFARLSALLGRPVETEDDVADATSGAIEDRDRQIRELKAPADGFRALTAELGETDPQKAVAKVKELKQRVADADAAAETARKTALAAQVDGILTTHEDRIVPAQRDYFAKQLTREILAGAKAGETETEKLLAALPTHGLTRRRSAADEGKNLTREQALDARRKELMRDQKMSVADALEQAEREIADEFGPAK